jgi:MFS family permease
VRAFGRVLGRPVLRRIMPAMLLSAIGDGMSVVAVAWLALQIAPPDESGVWTALAVAAYTLPATLGAAVLARLVRRLPSTALVTVDATLRAGTLGTVAALAIAGALAPATYVILLAASSLLHAWGNAGSYTLIAELVPDEDRLTGNALLSTFSQAAYVVGPGLAGVLTAWAGPGWVIAVDAASFAVLALTCRWATRSSAPPPVPKPSESTPASRAIRSDRRLAGLLAVTCVFFFLYGPVEVALPIHVAQEIHGSAALLGAFWAAFGVGAILGGLGAGLLRHRPLWTVVAAIIIGWGAALLPLGLTDAVVPGLVGFAAGGLIYGPFTAICTALFQRSSPPQLLSRVLATRTALTAPSTALGTLLGGPVVGAIGGRPTLLASALLTIALGVLVAFVTRRSRKDLVAFVTRRSRKDLVAFVTRRSRKTGGAAPPERGTGAPSSR